MDFNDRQYYLNRECTWLSFNQRVLRESTSKDNPLLERLRFIAISCSNLDESSTSSRAASSTTTSAA